MDAIQDFEDFLELLERHDVRHLIIGGLAFIYHAKPRFTKDIDVWSGSISRAGRAVAESPSSRRSLGRSLSGTRRFPDSSSDV